MTPRSRPRRAWIAAALWLWLGAFSAASADRLGPQGEPSGEWREQTWLVPLPHDGNRAMHAAVYRPPGDGKHPLAVINHGSPAKPEQRPAVKPAYKAAAAWFVRRGFVVALPIRRGYGATGGGWDETYGRCDNPDFRRAGLETAKDIRAAIQYMQQQSFVSPERALVVGQSAGGWGAVALASLNPPEVGAFVNFAGGRGGYAGGKPNSNCRADRLIEAAGEFGKTARGPMLWIYTENDLFFSPSISRGMAEAFAARGGRAEYRLLAPFGKDGHAMFGAADGLARWRGAVAAFLDANGF